MVGKIYYTLNIVFIFCLVISTYLSKEIFHTHQVLCIPKCVENYYFNATNCLSSSFQWKSHKIYKGLFPLWSCLLVKCGGYNITYCGKTIQHFKVRMCKHFAPSEKISWIPCFLTFSVKFITDALLFILKRFIY